MKTTGEMKNTVPGTSEIWLNDRDHLLHPFAEFPGFAEHGSRVFNRAEGVYVYSNSGESYLDGIGGLWCVNIGYGREEMARAIAEQALELPYYNTFTDMTSPPASRLAARLAELAPGDINHAFFTCSGSASNDTAVRLAQYYHFCRGQPQKTRIISRENAYHGSTYLAASLTGIRPNHEGFHTLLGGADPLIYHAAEPNMYRRPEGMDESQYSDFLVADLEALIARVGADKIACFIAEPIMGAGGVKVAPQGYHARIKALCEANNILYISDEVVTAFGRLGHFFASEDAFGVLPDIISTAKGISSGYVPLGAALFSDRIFEVISAPPVDGKPFSHGFTYSGHPVACAAGLKNIEILESENLCGHVRQVGKLFESRLQELAALPIVGDVRGSHLMMALEFVCDKPTKQSFDPAVTIGKRVATHAWERGLIARNVGDYIILSPPLIIDHEQVDSLVNILGESIEATVGDLHREGLLQT